MGIQTLEQFKVRDAESYDAVAEHFAHFTSIVTEPLAETMVGLADLKPAARVLDVGTGSGIVALKAAERMPSISVTGIDLSDGLLAVARRYTARLVPVPHIEFVKSDAERLPFPDRSFDSTVSLFALLHFPNPEQALAEMYRVLKPGGRLVLGIGSPPPWNTWHGWRHRLGRIFDLIDLKSGKLLLAPAHLNGIIDKYIAGGSAPEETELAQLRGGRAQKATGLIGKLGFNNIQTRWEGHHLVLRDAQEFWDLQSTFSSIARKRLELASAAQVEELRQAFDEDCQRVLTRGGRLVYHYAAFYISATRPES